MDEFRKGQRVHVEYDGTVSYGPADGFWRN